MLPVFLQVMADIPADKNESLQILLRHIVPTHPLKNIIHDLFEIGGGDRCQHGCRIGSLLRCFNCKGYFTGDHVGDQTMP